MLSRSLAGAIALAWFVTPAMAHITVLPERTVVDSPLELTIRVPTEGPVATTGVDVRFPPEFVVYSFATPPPGWWRCGAANSRRLSEIWRAVGKISPIRRV